MLPVCLRFWQLRRGGHRSLLFLRRIRRPSRWGGECVLRGGRGEIVLSEGSWQRVDDWVSLVSGWSFEFLKTLKCREFENI